MSLSDKQAIDRSTDDAARQAVQTEDDEASYVDSWYQVLKAQAADGA